MAASAMFVLVRLGSIILSVLTFWYGLALSDNQVVNVSEGNFNTQTIRFVSIPLHTAVLCKSFCIFLWNSFQLLLAYRLSVLASICIIQAYFMWHFITEQLQQMREQNALYAASRPKPKTEKKIASKKSKKEGE